MKVLALLPFFLFAIFSNVSGQYYSNQNKVWAFGNHCGVDFASGSPVSAPTNINTQEGTASVSDASGNLLFYTDGRNVYNKLGGLMTGGSPITFPTGSTSQAAAIVPVLGTTNRYYVFSLQEISAPGSTATLAYRIVDMSLASGLGDILPGAPVVLNTTLSEKMTVVQGTNCDVWLLAHKANSGEFLAYNVNSAGISVTPVSSITGSLATLGAYAFGVIKVSPDRKKVVATSVNGLEMYDFNPTTGVVSGCQQLSTNYSYGAEFSPDCTKLYIADVSGPTKNASQYDISLPTTTAIIASKTLLFAGYPPFTTDMKLGPDNKIYLNSLATSLNFLDRINYPNYAGTSCMYFGYAVSLAPGIPNIGLPNLYVTPGISPINGPNTLCLLNTVTYTCATAGGAWSSSDPGVASVTSSGVVTGVGAGTAIISYALPGCGTSTKNVTVETSAMPIWGTPIVCVGTTTTLSHVLSGGTWASSSPGIASVGASTGIVTGVAIGTTNITYTPAAGCIPPPFTVTVDLTPTAGTISGPSTLCISNTISLTSSVSGGLWNSSNTSVATVGSTGVVTGTGAGTATITYSVINNCATAIATWTVTVTALSTPITGDLDVCVGAITTLANATPGGTWSSSNPTVIPIVTFSTGQGIVSALAPGVATIMYSAGGAGCAAIATFTVYPIPIVDPISGPDAVCVNEPITLHNTTLSGVWGVRTGKASITSTTPGEVDVKGVAAGVDTVFYTVSNPACSTTVTKPITIYPIPDSGIIGGTNIVCKGAVITLSESVAGGTWSSGNPAIASIDNNGVVTAAEMGDVIITYSVGPNAAGCTNFAVYTIKVLLEGAFIVAGNPAQIKCYGDSSGSVSIGLLGNTVGPYKYQWSNGDSTKDVSNLVPGSYTVTVVDLSTQCIARNLFEIRQPDSLAITFDQKNDVCKTGNGSIKVEVAGGTIPYKYAWSNNTSFNEAIGLHAGTYAIKVTDANNCEKEMAFALVDDKCSDVVIPDVITPNSDGINDTWLLEGLQFYPASTVQIFDKWGDRVYDKLTYYNEWYGQNKNGNLLPDGTYYYIVKLNAPNPTGGKTEMVGYVFIKR
jgi:gliding motility-associated-like protein